MLELKQKIAYLHGLAEGLSMDSETKEGKLMSAILDVLEEVSAEIEDLAVNQDELEEYIEAIDEDLGDIEEDFYGDDEDCCDCCGDDDEDDEDFSEGSYIEVECPSCHDVVRFEASILEDEDVIEVYCPNCDEVVYVNDDESNIFDEDDEDDEDDEE